MSITAPLDAPREVTVEEGPHRLTLHLNAAGPVGLAFDALDFATDVPPRVVARGAPRLGRPPRRAPDLPDGAPGRPGARPDRRPGRDPQRVPHPPVRPRTYYEVRLHPRGTLRLSRVSYDEATRQRRPAPCQLTREALERLADDLVASVA